MSSKKSSKLKQATAGFHLADILNDIDENDYEDIKFDTFYSYFNDVITINEDDLYEDIIEKLRKSLDNEEVCDAIIQLYEAVFLQKNNE